MACSPRGQVEVSVECHASTQPTPLLLSFPSFPIPVTKRASLVAKETGFFHGDVGTRGKGRAALFRPVMKDSPHACLIARLIVANPRAEPIHQPDYVQWSF